MSVNPASVTNPPAQFPEDFVFGGATAAYQVEGETRTHGKGKVAWDDFLEAQGRFSPDPASDFYNQYPVDLELCEEFGINGIRLSIAWSRIFPNGTGEINPEGVQFYHDLFAECHKHHVEPFVTLHHFDTPLALFEKGDFLNRETIDAFVGFATFCFKEYADQVTYWFTFNEIWADASNTYIEGTFPGGVKAHLAEAFQCEHNMMLAHAKAVLAFHNGGFKGKIGVIQSLEFKYPLNENDPADIKAANNEHVLQNQFLLDATFRGDYAPDTLECANRLAAVSGGTIEILDEDLEIMREAALYNDYLGVNNYQCRFLKAYDGENDLHHNGTGEKGTGRWRVKGIGEHVNKPGIPTPTGTGSSIPRACSICSSTLSSATPTTSRSSSPRTAWATRTPTRTVLWTTSRASTTSSSTCAGCSRPWRWVSTWAATSCGACRISSPGPMATTSVTASSTLTLKPRSARPRQAHTGISTWRRPVVWTSGLRRAVGGVAPPT